MKPRGGALLPALDRGRDGGGPLHRKLYARIRGAILDGALGPGARLPSARTLAGDLGLSRTTVETALAQLDAEGFLIRRVGAGSYVAHDLPAHASRALRASRPAAPAAPLSARGRATLAAALQPDPTTPRLFAPCMPALDLFPAETWGRLVARRARRAGREILCYGEPAGYRPLREAVAAYLAAARGVRCDWRQVLILTSTQQALDLAARLLLDPGDAAWLEEPGYLGARAALRSAEVRIVPVPVDEQGLDVDAGVAAAPAARLVYVSPSHQYPLGVTLSLSRRLALLAWAARARAWVIEDDYDSEFRYRGRPLAAMQGLDDAGRVLYVGSFNKVLFPSLRLAYLVVPDGVADAFAAARGLVDGHTPTLAQAVLADFLDGGHFTAHLRQMRAVYEERRDVFRDAVQGELGDRLRLGPADAGMHLAARLPAGSDDVDAVRRAAELGIETRALSRHYLARDRARGARAGLVLGWTAAPAPEIRRAVHLLSKGLG